MNLFALIPGVYRWIALGVLLAAFGGFCFVKGLNWSRAEHEAFVARVEAEGRIAQERAAQKTREAKQITKEVGDAYAETVTAIRNDYARRLRDARAASRPVPTLPGPSVRADAPAPDPGVGAAVLAAEIQSLKDEIKTIEAAAAQTTAQLLYLQGWIREQQNIFASAQVSLGRVQHPSQD